jgi:gliding motility-associated-like protein
MKLLKTFVPKFGLLILIALQLSTFNSTAQQVAKKTPTTWPYNGIGYYEYVPSDYNSNTDNYPVVIFLHGLGERGNGTTDLYKVASNGPAKHVKNGTQFPFILISPQLTTSLTDWPPRFVDEMIEYVQTYLRVDKSRIYLTGLSLGGGGVWWYAQNPVYAAKLAAIAPVCGSRTDNSLACSIANENLPVWAFHGDADGTISVQKSINMVNAINSCVPTPSPLAKLTIYPGVGHNAWDNAYRTDNSLHTPNIYQWMLGFSKSTLTVSAGSDFTINLPTNSTNITGSATTGSGTITSYAWSKLNGPTATLANTNTAVLSVTNMLQGVYTFRLVVTNSNGESSQDDIVVTVVQVNQNPAADAGPDLSLTLPTNSVLITGSGTDPDGSIATYAWAKVSGPTATMSGQATSSLSLSNLLQGTYVYSFTVTDNNGASAVDNVQIVVNPAAVNQIPTASAGPGATINLPTNSTTLTGSGSDPDGSISTYLWEKLTGPAATLTNANTAVLSLTNLVAGSYTFRLTVTDNQGATANSQTTVIVNAANQAPVANAGIPITITLPTNSTNLTGLGTDADGSIAIYAWTQVSGPNSATLTNASAPTVSISLLIQGVYTFRFGVTDNQGATASSTVTVTVNAAPVNVPPTANAGSDKSITLPISSVVLNGSGTDIDGSIASYSWTKFSGPTATLTNQNTQNLTASALSAGTYVFRLTVTDNQGATAFANATVTVQPAAVNQAPLVSVGANFSLTLPTNSTTISSTASDPDGSISTYLWEKISGPATGDLTGIATSSLSLTNLVAGVYVLRLTVTDNLGATANDDITVSVVLGNQAPNAVASSDQTITLPVSSTTLSVVASDPDGTIASYLWINTSGPAAPTMVGAVTNSLAVSGLVEGTYVFKITVTDDNGATAFDEVNVIVQSAINISPTANAGSPKTIILPTNSTNFIGSGNDPDGSIVGYTWTQTGGPASTLSNANTQTLSVVITTNGVYTFRLTVTDNNGATGSANVTLTVNPAAVNQPPVAEAGANQSITLPTNSTIFNGTASDPDGSIATYLWSKISGPAAGVLTNASTPSLTISSVVQGTYVLRFTVTDNGGLSISDNVTLNVLPQAVNQAPIASAGTNKTLTLPTNSVTLSGSGTDVDGSVVTYLWTKLSGPTAVLANENTPTLTLTNLLEGIYVFELTVTDNLGATGTANATITVNAATVNQNPIADAGPDRVITLPTNIITLVGSGSDADGSIASYSWTKTSGPTVTLGTANLSSISLSDLIEGTYIFQLLVIDNMGATSADNATITVLPQGINQPPVVSAGSDKNLFLPANSISLSGSVNDADGTIASFGWTQVSGPASVLINANTTSLTASSLTEGTFVYRLSATDDDGASSFDEVTVIVNAAAANKPPVANAGVDKILSLPTNSVVLNGTGTDEDGTIASYLWTKVSGPPGVLANETTADLSLTSLVEGNYLFSLLVTDDLGATNTDNVSVSVLAASFNQPPVVDAGPTISIQLPLNAADLNGSATDDGTIATISWTQISGPSTSVITNSATLSATATVLQAGIYVFQLSATDNDGVTSTDNVSVSVNAAAPPPPTLLVDAGPDVIIQLPDNTATVVAIATADNVLITTFKWVQISGTAVTITDETSNELILSDLTPGTYAFEITVTDALDQTATDNVTITVLEEDPSLRPKNSFSPNNDGQFDTWTIENPQLATECKISVYSRTGRKVFESIGYEKEWDGFSNGNVLPEGVYFYIIECSGSKQSGSITLLK